MTVKECFLDIVPFIINEYLLLLVSLAKIHEFSMKNFLALLVNLCPPPQFFHFLFVFC